jgi:MFS family permease
VPFLASVVLIGVGLFVRLRVEESPIFHEEKENRRPIPAIDVLRRHRRDMLLAAGAFVGLNALGTIFAVYGLSYATSVARFPQQTVLVVIICASAAWIGAIAASAAWSDRVGRRRVYLICIAAQAVWCLAFFPLVDTRSVPGLVLAFVVLGVIQGAANGPQPAMFAELFPTELRYSGVSLAYQLGAIVGGGLAPIVAATLLSASHTSLAITGYLVMISLLSLGCTVFLPETSHRDLAHIGDPLPRVGEPR